MSKDFNRPTEGFRFLPGGLKTNMVADAIPRDKYPLATNVRWLLDGSVRSRYGQSLKFLTIGNPITDIGAYATLSTDNQPRYLARDTTDKIWLDNGVQVGTLASGGLGAMFMPFRPAQSPQSWLYVANGADYQKFSAPIANAVTQRRVGIAEPQSAPDACPDSFFNVYLDQPAAGWTAGGTAGALSNVARISDTAVAVFTDPASNPQIAGAARISVQVAAAQQYQPGAVITWDGAGAKSIIQDVISPAAFTTAISIQAIQYLSGSTGKCVISCKSLFTSRATDLRTGQSLLSIMRRGAIFTFAGGTAETTIVLSATVGPDGSIALETSTTVNHVAGETIKFQPTIILDATLAAAQAFQDAIQPVQSSVAVGTGFISQVFPSNPFLLLMTENVGGGSITNNTVARSDDYFHFSINVSDLTQLSTTGPAVRFLIDVGDGTFGANYYYFDIAASDLVSAVASTQTQLGAAQIAAQRQRVRLGASQLGGGGIREPRLDRDGGDSSDLTSAGFGSAGSQTALGASQWTEILFPLTALTRVGNDLSKSLYTANAMRVQIITAGTITVKIGSFWIGAGGLPDVGSVGTPYLYRVRPRDSRTGVRGNPSPATRYGVLPRRQQVAVVTPGASDPQIDTWDVFRYGGSVTSWRYVGSVAAFQGVSSIFYDNVFDDSATAGEPLDFDNFEPWPSVDLPQNLTALQVTGTLMTVTIPAPTNALRWLPGTLIQLIGTRAVYTLRRRPVLISGTTYLVEVEEPAAFAANAALSIPEPALGNQKLPYIWGPDASGYVYACGDPLRPGTVYFSKPYAPDQCPDTNNQEICGPHEPLLGGEILDGLSFVASPERQWALYPQPDNPAQKFNVVQQSEQRGIAAPYGHCNDGKTVYYWAKDGIRASQVGSLTDADLYNLFPHEGVVAQDYTYFGQTYKAPDYSRAGTFRLALVNYYLYAIYQDTGGIYRCLTLDTRRGSWCVDAWTPAVSTILHPSQQAGTLLTTGTRYEELLTGNTSGQVAQEVDLSNDLGSAIACTLATSEFDGGDVRAPVQWGDIFLDLVAAANAGILMSPVSLGALVLPIGITIPTSAVRQRLPISIGGIVVSDFMGLVFQWTDTFPTQSVPTQFHVWQPSFDLQPTRDIAFFTFGTSFNLRGFMHIPEMTWAYVSTQPVTLTISVVDGTAPVPIILPSSIGVYTKKFFRPTINKGRLYNFSFTSTAPFQIFEDDSELLVGEWGRQGPYELIRGLGERTRESAPI